MEQIKQTLENTLSTIEDTGILNDDNLDLLASAAKNYEVVVIELKKTDGSKFGQLPDQIDGFQENNNEARTNIVNVDLYHTYRTDVVRKIENVINIL